MCNVYIFFLMFCVLSAYRAYLSLFLGFPPSFYFSRISCCSKRFLGMLKLILSMVLLALSQTIHAWQMIPSYITLCDSFQNLDLTLSLLVLLFSYVPSNEYCYSEWCCSKLLMRALSDCFHVRPHISSTLLSWNLPGSLNRDHSLASYFLLIGCVVRQCSQHLIPILLIDKENGSGLAYSTANIFSPHLNVFISL